MKVKLPQTLNPPNRILLPLIPLLIHPQLNQPPGSNSIPLPQQRRNVHIQRRVDPGCRQQHPDGAYTLEYAISRRPRVLEQVETDLARLQVNIGVHDGRHELDGRRVQRVGRRDGDAEEPAAVYLSQR
jgi:hypothetical protein